MRENPNKCNENHWKKTRFSRRTAALYASCSFQIKKGQKGHNYFPKTRWEFSIKRHSLAHAKPDLEVIHLHESAENSFFF